MEQLSIVVTNEQNSLGGFFLNTRGTFGILIVKFSIIIMVFI